MSAATIALRTLSKWLRKDATFVTSTLLIHLVTPSDLLALDLPKVESVEHGLFPYMFFTWALAFLSVVVVNYIDEKRESSLETRNRLLIVAAIFVALSGSWTVFYGVTTSPDEWRMWDHINYEEREMYERTF